MKRKYEGLIVLNTKGKIVGTITMTDIIAGMVPPNPDVPS